MTVTNNTDQRALGHTFNDSRKPNSGDLIKANKTEQSHFTVTKAPRHHITGKFIPKR
jgi:hypothetical protein